MPVACNDCGYENRLSAIICGSCGATLADSATCPACALANLRGQRFCNECGAALLGGARPAVAEGQPQPVALSLPSATAPLSRREMSVGRFGSYEDILVHAAVALVFSLAVVARLVGLGSFPDGLTDSESAIRGAVSDIVDGQLIGLWSEAVGGQPTGFVYWLAGWSSLLGDGTAALRLMSAWLGLAAVGMFYVYCRAAFGIRASVLGSMLLAVSLWHMGYSRLALPVGSLVLFQLAASYLLLVALSEGDGGSPRYRPLVLAGVVFGVAVYTHNAFYIFAIAVGLWWAREFLAGDHSMGVVLKRCAAFLATALVVAVPYLWSLAAHSEEVGDRVSAIDLSSSEEYIDQPGLMERTRFAMRRIVTTGGALLLSRAQDDGPTRRLLDPATALLAAAGLIAGLWRWRQREFFHMWSIAITAVVVVGLTRDEGMYGRLIVALPAVYTAAGYAFDGLLVLMRGRAGETAAFVVIALIVTAAGLYNIVSYYDSPVGIDEPRWAQDAPRGTGTRATAAFRKRRRDTVATLGSRADGAVTLEVRVRPKAGRNDVALDGADVKVYVTAPAEGGRANAAVVALLADRLGVGKDGIAIVKGHRARDKVIRIEVLDAVTIKKRLVATESTGPRGG